MKNGWSTVFLLFQMVAEHFRNTKNWTIPILLIFGCPEKQFTSSQVPYCWNKCFLVLENSEKWQCHSSRACAFQGWRAPFSITHSAATFPLPLEKLMPVATVSLFPCFPPRVLWLGPGEQSIIQGPWRFRCTEHGSTKTGRKTVYESTVLWESQHSLLVPV